MSLIKVTVVISVICKCCGRIEHTESDCDPSPSGAKDEFILLRQRGVVTKGSGSAERWTLDYEQEIAICPECVERMRPPEPVVDSLDVLDRQEEREEEKKSVGRCMGCWHEW